MGLKAADPLDCYAAYEHSFDKLSKRLLATKMPYSQGLRKLIVKISYTYSSLLFLICSICSAAISQEQNRNNINIMLTPQ